MNDKALQIKHSVSIESAFALLGLTKNRKGYICCPFHNEKTASLKIYAHNNTYFCFGCHKSGDVIKLYQDFYNENFIEAAKHIDSDFSLSLFEEKKSYKHNSKLDELKRKEIAKKFKMAEIERVESKRAEWLSKWISADIALREKKPKQQDEELQQEFIEALKNIEYYAYIVDCWEYELWRCNSGR